MLFNDDVHIPFRNTYKVFEEYVIWYKEYSSEKNEILRKEHGMTYFDNWYEVK